MAELGHFKFQGKAKKIVFLKISKSGPKNGHKSAEKGDFQKIFEEMLSLGPVFL